MKKLCLIVFVSYSLSAFAQKQDYPIQPVAFTNVKLSDHFWTSRIETNRTVTIPASFERCEKYRQGKKLSDGSRAQGQVLHYLSV
jgi:hypothetical protein